MQNRKPVWNASSCSIFMANEAERTVAQRGRQRAVLNRGGVAKHPRFGPFPVSGRVIPIASFQQFRQFKARD